VPRVHLGPISLEVRPDWTLSTLILAGPQPGSPPEDAEDDRLLLTEGRPFQASLVATMEQVANDVTPEGYVRRQLEDLRKAQVKRHESRSPETVQLAGGREGLLTEQVVVAQAGEVVRQLQLVTIKDGVAYTLITSALDGPMYQREYPGFRQMLLSFS
jgi:hypothetical protein